MAARCHVQLLIASQASIINQHKNRNWTVLICSAKVQNM